MLSIQQPSSSSAAACGSPIPKYTPNILPCRINQSGPVKASKRYWNVEDDEKGRKVAYFRGRKLLGREVKINEDYRGVLVQHTDRTLPNSSATDEGKGNSRDTARLVTEEEEDAEEEEAEPVKVLEEVGSFDKIIVWGHEQVPGEDDVFVRGVEEWIGFAQAMHEYDDGKTEVTT